MTATALSPIDRLKSALGDAYAIDRELISNMSSVLMPAAK